MLLNRTSGRQANEAGKFEAFEAPKKSSRSFGEFVLLTILSFGFCRVDEENLSRFSSSKFGITDDINYSK